MLGTLGMEENFPALLLFFDEYRALAVFMSVFFLGEIAILLIASLLVFQDSPLHLIFPWMLAGALTADLFWYFVGRKFLSARKHGSVYDKIHLSITPLLDKVTGKRPFVILLCLKFFYGLRLITMAYLGARKTPFRTFLWYDFFGTVPWLIILLLISYGAAKGLYNFVPAYHGFQRGLLTLAVILIIYKIGTWYARKKWLKM